MIHARLDENIVVEIIDCDDLDNCYHPDFVAQLVECDKSVSVGMMLNGKDFVNAVEQSSFSTVADQSLAIDAHINDCIKSRDFDDIGQVALCCADGNGYQVEALAVSAWVRKCWKKQEDIKSGKRVFKSIDDAIKDLPDFDICD